MNCCKNSLNNSCMNSHKNSHKNSHIQIAVRGSAPKFRGVCESCARSTVHKTTGRFNKFKFEKKKI